MLHESASEHYEDTGDYYWDTTTCVEPSNALTMQEKLAVFSYSVLVGIAIFGLMMVLWWTI